MPHYITTLTIAGSDSSGGAGIQADIKTMSALGCFATSVITAVTAQNTTGVKAIHHIPADIIAAQIDAVLDDMPPMAIKIGMISSAEAAQVICDRLRKVRVPIVLDPVMTSTSGHSLSAMPVMSYVMTHIASLATVITPNIPEARLLSGMDISSAADMTAAAKMLARNTGSNILLKGGHLGTGKTIDILIDREAKHETIYEHDRIDTRNLHGTGCTLSSAIASMLAKGLPPQAAIAAATDYVHSCIRAGSNVSAGKGQGPLNHFSHPLALEIREK